MWLTFAQTAVYYLMFVQIVYHLPTNLIFTPLLTASFHSMEISLFLRPI